MLTKGLRLIIYSIIIILTISPYRTIATVQAEMTEKFEPFADSYVDSENSNSNYASADLRVSNYEFLSNDIWIEWTYIAFEVTGLPTDATVTDVKLEISVKSMPLDDHSVDLQIWECGSFSETTLNWDNQPTTDINVIDFVSWGTITSDSRWEFTLSDDGAGSYEPHTVRSNGNYYFLLHTITDNIWAITFDSRDDIWNPPELAVTYTYTPVTTTTTVGGPLFGNGGYSPLYALLGLAILGVGGAALVYWKVILPKKKIAEKKITPLEFSTPTPQFCTNCGNPMPIGNFCQKCGARRE